MEHLAPPAWHPPLVPRRRLWQTCNTITVGCTSAPAPGAAAVDMLWSVIPRDERMPMAVPTVGGTLEIERQPVGADVVSAAAAAWDGRRLALAGLCAALLHVAILAGAPLGLSNEDRFGAGGIDLEAISVEVTVVPAIAAAARTAVAAETTTEPNAGPGQLSVPALVPSRPEPPAKASAVGPDPVPETPVIEEAAPRPEAIAEIRPPAPPVPTPIDEPPKEAPEPRPAPSSAGDGGAPSVPVSSPALADRLVNPITATEGRADA